MRKIILFLSVAFILYLCFGCSKSIIELSSASNKIKGVSFVASRDSISQEQVEAVIGVNGNSVALMPFAFLTSINSPEINYNSSRQWFGETPKGLKQYGLLFKKNNVKILVKPQLWIRDGSYTGLIEMSSEENWQLLENSYEQYILDYAQIAQEINAEYFCIGTELEKFVQARPNYWISIISKIRTIYKGKLTYAANWDEYHKIDIWQQLDFIGIDAYFPLSAAETPETADLIDHWKPIKETIKLVHIKYKKPIIFSEYGYRSIHYTTKEPWDATRIDGNLNFQGQSNALTAIYKSFWNEDWFEGGFIWKWFPNHLSAGGLNDNQFTPQNKPSQLILKELYEETN